MQAHNQRTLTKKQIRKGWPEGPSKSFTSNEPVNVQISNWLKGMGMMEEDINK